MRSAAATGRNGLESLTVDLKTTHFNRPGMRVLALQNDLAPEGIAGKIGLLAAAKTEEGRRLYSEILRKRLNIRPFRRLLYL